MSEAATEDQKAEREARRHREAVLALFLLLLQATNAEMRATAMQFLLGRSTPEALAAQFVFTLGRAHAHASYFGRVLAGDPELPNEADMQRAAAVMETQAIFLKGLVRDLKHGRYALTEEEPEGNPQGASGRERVPSGWGDLTNRLLLYSLRLRGTANEAWISALPAQTSIYWRLGKSEKPRRVPTRSRGQVAGVLGYASEQSGLSGFPERLRDSRSASEHCRSCEVYAAGSPYTPATLPTTPGSAECICLSACRCSLEIDGMPAGVPFPGGI